MKLIARKACSFGGKKFYIGDEIPEEIVLDPQVQDKRGVLTIVNDDAVTPPPAEHEEVRNEVDTMNVVVHAKEGDMPLDLTKEGLQAVVDVLTGNAEDAAPIVADMTDGEALILLHLVDNRKAVRTAAEARAQVLNAEPGNPEESAGDQ